MECNKSFYELINSNAKNQYDEFLDYGDSCNNPFIIR
jgi:hypothetical protein